MIIVIMTKKNKKAVYRHYIYYGSVCPHTAPNFQPVIANLRCLINRGRADRRGKYEDL
jgi:hypothetical protein